MAKINLTLKTLAQVVVTTAGTRVPLSATSLEVRQAVVQYDPSNTGSVYIGQNDVAVGKCLVLNASNPSISLEAEDTVADEDNVFFDLADVYVDATVNGSKVNVAYVDVTGKKYNA